jgi:hypothetical protein
MIEKNQPFRLETGDIREFLNLDRKEDEIEPNIAFTQNRVEKNSYIRIYKPEE